MKQLISQGVMILFWIIFIITPRTGNTTTYYVVQNHASASDSNPGTQESPWLTIQHAAETLVAGDTVFIATGTYHEPVYFENAGNAIDGHIVFTALPGDVPVIDGTGVTEANNGLVMDKDYIKLHGLEISNWNENAIWIESAAFFEISDCVVHHAFYGIGVADGSHDFVFNRVEAHHFDLYGFDVSPSDGADCYNGTFNDCLSHTGRDPQQNVDGYALGHGTQHDFEFKRCVAYDVFDGFDISSRNATLNECLAYKCGNGAYKLWQDNVSLINCIGYDCTGSVVELDWDGEPGVTTLVNCSFYSSQSFVIWVENAGDHLHMVNCIIAGGQNIGLAFEQRSAENYVGDYNLFHNESERAIAVGYEDEFSLNQIESGAWTSYSGQDSHSLVSQSDTDIFADPAAFNLHLSATSNAIDSGTDVDAPSQDYDGNGRPAGNGYDIGAFEYNGSVGILENEVRFPETAILYQNFPNPFNPATTIQYNVTMMQHVELNIYNELGQKIRTLVSGIRNAGYQSIIWDGKDDLNHVVKGGIYLCALHIGSRTQTRKMLLLR